MRMITDKVTGKPKGFAFLEFTDVQCFTKALAFHHTTLKKRALNVEMTSGGGGNSENRRRKITDKNDQLHDKRKQIHEKRLLAGKVVAVADDNSNSNHTNTNTNTNNHSDATDQHQQHTSNNKKKQPGKKGGAAHSDLSRSDMEMAQKMQEIAENGRYIVSGPNSIAVKKRQQ